MRRPWSFNIALLAVAITAGCSRPAESTSSAPQPPAASEAQAASKPVSGGADWPQFLGPNATGMSSEKGINKAWASRPPKALWRAPMGDDGYAGPAVAGGLVFILDVQNGQSCVKALSLATGKQKWATPVPDSGGSNYGFGKSTPAVSGGKVYAITRNALVVCLDAAAGSLVWSKDLVAEAGARKPTWEFATSPVIDGDRVLAAVGAAGACLVALDKKSGEILWRGGNDDGPGYSTPTVATLNGQKQIIVFSAKQVMGIAPDTGRAIWSHPWQTSYDVHAATPRVLDNTVIVTSGYGTGGARLDVSGGSASVRWQNKDLQSRFTTPILAGGFLYCTGERGELACIDSANGRVAWSRSGFEWGGLVGVDGTLIVMNGSNGDVVQVAMSPAGYKELGRIAPLGGQAWTAPIVAQGRLLVRNKKELVCLDLK